MFVQAYRQAIVFDSTERFSYISTVSSSPFTKMTTLRRRFEHYIWACICVCGLASAGVAFASESPVPEPDTPVGTMQDLSTRASELAIRAMGLIGIRYKYGGTAPESGFDCSGLVRYVFKDVSGTELPRTSEEISRVGEHVDTQNLQPGDLVFYNTLRRAFSHVGVYLGDNKFVHAPSGGGKVRIESMDVGYWKKRFNGARRINQPE